MAVLVRPPPVPIIVIMYVPMDVVDEVVIVIVLGKVG